MKLNFRTASSLFIILLSAFTILLNFVCPCNFSWISFYCHNAWIFYTCLIILFFGSSLAMAFFPSSGFHYPYVFTHGKNDEKIISLSFDDGPDPLFTPLILDILKQHEITATFFIIGKKIGGNEDILRRMVSEGHIVGNHSWAHTNLWDFSSARRMTADLERNISEMAKITGRKMKLFRPPFGVINPMVARAVKKTGVKVVTWSFRSFDTVAKDPSVLLQKTLAGVKAGDILLFHDTCGITAGILENLIVTLQAEKFRFVPLVELINTQAYE